MRSGQGRRDDDFAIGRADGYRRFRNCFPRAWDAGLLPIPGLLSSALALLFGYLSRSHRGNSQPATAGIVLGWIGVILGVTVMFVYFVLLGVSASGDPSLPLVAQCSLIVHMTNQTAPRFR
jgi:hypothetical protein